MYSHQSKYQQIKVLITTFVIILGIFSLIPGCKEEPLPKWDEEKMIHIFADLRIIDSQVKKHDLIERDSVKLLYKQKLLDIYKISEEDLKYHIELVQSDPHLAKPLEEKVIDYLTALRKEASKEQ